MKILALVFSILWAITIIVILYSKVTLFGLDANNLSLILSAIFAIITSVLYFYPASEPSVKQVAKAENNSSIVQIGRDYKEK